MKKTIGILGGMGPLATADLFCKIITHTQASKDQEHIPILIDNNTAIPDRTTALLHGGDDPMPEMTKSAKRLEAAGADVLIMPCNTAHNYFELLQQRVNIPFLNMIDLTCQAMLEKGVTTAGLLATTGTIQTGIYQRYASQYGITIFCPDDVQQEDVMQLIYSGVKAGNESFAVKPVQQCAQELLARGAQVMILGCTELPVAMQMYPLSFPAVDPTLELALAAIRFASNG